MKTIYLLALTAILLSCKKEVNSGNPRREEIGMATAINIGAQTDSHIKSQVVKKDSIITVYQNGLTFIEVSNSQNPILTTLILRYGLKYFTYYRKITPVTNGTLNEIVASPVQGAMKYHSFVLSPDKTSYGQFTMYNPLPVHLIGGDDRTYYDCMQEIVKFCKASWACKIYFTISYLAIINGASIMCFATTRR